MTLDDLAKAILTRPLADARARKPFEVPFDVWIDCYKAMIHRCKEEDRPLLADAKVPRPNFICCATPVVSSEL